MLPIYQDLAIDSRRAMLQELLLGPKTVSQLVEATGYKQPNVSNHLAKMREHDTVRVTRDGRLMIYRLAGPEIAEAVRMAGTVRSQVLTELNLPELAERFAHFGVMGDEARCADVVDYVLRTGQPVIEVYEELISRSMHIVGRMYEQRAIDEAQEHAASEITERMLARISSAQPPARSNGRTAVLGCAANNWHTIGLRMLADYLRQQGWKVIFLGANVPTEAFSRSVGQHQAHVVMVSSSSESIQEARTLIKELKSTYPAAVLALGGSGPLRAPERFEDLPVDFRGFSLRDTATQLTSWLEGKTNPASGSRSAETAEIEAG